MGRGPICKVLIYVWMFSEDYFLMDERAFKISELLAHLLPSRNKLCSFNKTECATRGVIGWLQLLCILETAGNDKYSARADGPWRFVHSADSAMQYVRMRNNRRA